MRAADTAVSRGIPGAKSFYIILGLGILIRMAFLLWVADKPLMSDAASYNEMSIRLLHGEAFVPFWPPGLPLYLAVLHKLFGLSAMVARLGMLIFYIGTSVFVYRTAELVTENRAVGNTALAMLALSPTSIHFSAEPLTQMPTAMLITVIVYYLIRLESARSIGNVAMLGIAASGLVLIRPSSLLFLAILPPYLLWRMRRAMPSLAMTAIAVVTVGSWIGYVYKKTGQFVKINTANSINFYLGNNAYTPIYRTWWLGSHHSQPEVPSGFVQEFARIRELDEKAQDVEFSRLAREHLRQHAGLFLLRSVNRVCTYLAFDTFTGAYLIGNYGVSKFVGFLTIAGDAFLFVLVALGSIFFFTVPSLRQRSIAPFLILGTSLLYALPYFFAFSHPSYHYPLEPILMVLSSGFLVHLCKVRGAWLRDIMASRNMSLALVLVGFTFVQIEYLLIVMLHRT